MEHTRTTLLEYIIDYCNDQLKDLRDWESIKTDIENILEGWEILREVEQSNT